MHLFATREKKKTHRFNYWKEFRKHKNSFFQSCLQYTNSHYQDAEDLLSEAMCKAHLQMKETKEKISHFHKWFQRIIYNIHLNSTNHNSRLTYLENVEDALNESGINTATPYRLALDKEVEEQLKKALQMLSPQQGYLCRLYFDGHSYEEIARANKLSVNNLRKIIQLNKEVLQKNFKNYKSCSAGPKAREIVYDHLAAYKIDKETHYSFLYSSINPQRLKQKASALQNYLEQYPYSAEKRFQLAKTLYCLGKFKEALKNIERLHEEKFFNEESFEIKIKIEQLTDRKLEVAKTAHEAIDKLACAQVQFQLWKINTESKPQKSMLYLTKLIREEPGNICLRNLLVEKLKADEQYFEAFQESKKAQEIDPNSVELFPVLLFGTLKFESFKKAFSLIETQLCSEPDSLSASLYYIHFLVKKGCSKDHPQVNKIYRQLRRKYFRHPDYVLLKAILNKRDLLKTFKRRLKDYPDCVLSKHYGRHFAGICNSLPALTPNEQIHFETLKLIYKGE